MKSKISSFFYKVFSFKKDLKEVKRIVKEIEDAVKPFIGIHNGIETITKFFNAIAPIYDRDPLEPFVFKFKQINNKTVQDTARIIEVIRDHYLNAGRDEYGLNRTKKGQTVYDDYIFLGDICGLSTQPVSYWKTCKDDKKGGWGFPDPELENMNVYDVVSRQARNFINSHLSKEWGLPLLFRKLEELIMI